METKNFAFTVKVIPGLEGIRQNGLVAKVGLIVVSKYWHQHNHQQNQHNHQHNKDNQQHN